MIENNIKKTNTFIKNQVLDNEVDFEKIFKPTLVVHTIDDCMVTQDLEIVNIENEIKDMQKLMGDRFPEYIEFYSEILDSTVPVLNYNDYLKELKELSLKQTNKKSFRQLRRMFLNGEGNTVVTCCVVLGLNKGRATIVNEVYDDGVFIVAKQYDLEEVMANYASLSGKNLKNEGLRILR